jgi:hypothetical protein
MTAFRKGEKIIVDEEGEMIPAVVDDITSEGVKVHFALPQKMKDEAFKRGAGLYSGHITFTSTKNLRKVDLATWKKVQREEIRDLKKALRSE